MTPITPKKVAGALLFAGGVYVVVGAAQNTFMGDLMTCDTCGRKASGYGFVAFVTGADQRVCPACKSPTLRPATLWDMAKAVVLGR